MITLVFRKWHLGLLVLMTILAFVIVWVFGGLYGYNLGLRADNRAAPERSISIRLGETVFNADTQQGSFQVLVETGSLTSHDNLILTCWPDPHDRSIEIEFTMTYLDGFYNWDHVTLDTVIVCRAQIVGDNGEVFAESEELELKFPPTSESSA